MPRVLLSLICCFILMTASHVSAEKATEILSFSSEENRKNYTSLINELRCLVCENQSIAGSNAELAKDLRVKVYGLVESGNSRSDVIEYMVSRYGDYVLYRPAFQLSTLLLWLGPIIFLIMTIWLVIRWVRSQEAIDDRPSPLNDEQRQKVRDLLDRGKG